MGGEVYFGGGGWTPEGMALASMIVGRCLGPVQPDQPGVLVGFTGGRDLPVKWASLVERVVKSVRQGDRRPAVGCAAGADELVRAADPDALVFRVRSGEWGPGLGAYAARSAAMVAAVAASGAGAGVVGFAGEPCPVRLKPARQAYDCFAGFGSGTWATMALAVGLGLPVVVFWCSDLPVSLPAWPGGSWQPAAAEGLWAQGWRWTPAAEQPLLI
jgi:hypothetical protein